MVSSAELKYLIRQGIDRAVMGELALEMTDYALRSLGVSEERCKLLTQWLRNEGVAGQDRRRIRGRDERFSCSRL